MDRALALVAESPPEHRTLTELSVQLQSRELKAALRPYTVDGNLGHLLDANADGLGLSRSPTNGGGGEGVLHGRPLPVDERYHVFEMKHLVDLSDKVLVPVLLYLFRRVEQRPRGRPPDAHRDRGGRGRR